MSMGDAADMLIESEGYPCEYCGEFHYDHLDAEKCEILSEEKDL